MLMHGVRQLDLGQAAGHFAGAAVRFYARAQAGLHAASRVIEANAKAKMGDYQPSVGGYAGWVELADSTKAQRVGAGYTENDPLVRSGELRKSINHEVWGLEAAIGSEDPVMAYQELGTRDGHIPPRPVLGPAAFESRDAVQRILGNVAMSGVLDVDLGRRDGRAIGRPGDDVDIQSW